MKQSARWVAYAAAWCLGWQAMLVQAQGVPLIGTEQVAQSQGVESAESQRARLDAMLDRADVVAMLQERGVTLQAARERIAAMTEAEVAQMAHAIDTAPAGASDLLGTAVFIFVLLLFTDILGFTKVFPFTRPIR